MDNKEAIEILQRNIPGCDYDLSEAVTLAIAALEQQGKDNEWCIDCKEYDKEQHCCHRFTKVIRQAVEEHRREWPDSKWIPVTERLPEEETDVLICNVNGDIAISRGSMSTESTESWIWYTSGWRFGKVTAWRPLPDHYQEEQKE